MKKKMNNKGFSLVELIVVIAIMAVLIGVLAPQFLKYVEKSRLAKDNLAISEIANAVKIALADETVNEGTTFPVAITIGGTAGNNKTVSFPKTGETNATALTNELNSTIAASYTTSSNTYKNSNVAIVIEVKQDNGNITVSATGWIEEPGSTTTITKNF